MRALVVVDMQEKFAGSGVPSCYQAVKLLIQSAVEQKDLIFFLEFMGFGQTRQDLVAAAGDYDNVFYTRKNTDDGSSEVIKLLEKLKKVNKVTKFVVCGVNASACVFETVLGLSDRAVAQVTVVEEATTNDPNWNEEKYGIDPLQRLKAVAERRKNVNLTPMMALR